MARRENLTRISNCNRIVKDEKKEKKKEEGNLANGEQKTPAK